MVGCISGGRCEDLVNSVENAAVYMLAERGGALSMTNEVIHEHINMGDRARVKEEWRLEIGGWTAGREHERSECGTGALPGGDQQITQGGDQCTVDPPEGAQLLQAWNQHSAQQGPADHPRWGPADPREC